MGYRLNPHQPVADEVRRIAARQLELAITVLTATGETGGSVHEARHHLKNVRALARLVRPVLGRRYRAVNDRLRTVNRLLGSQSDAQDAVATWARVADRYRNELPPDIAAEIHATLVRRESMAYENAVLKQVFHTVVGVLRAERDAVAEWTLTRTGFRAIAGGLERTARASRRAMATAVRSSRSEDYHTWRQRVKDQWLHLRLLQARCGEGLAIDGRRLEALDGYLGECHNRAILREVLASDSTLNRTDAARCLQLVRRDERELRRCARRLGQAIYHETATDFVRRVRRLWRSARRSGRTDKRGAPWQSAA